ncbi:TetR/AcrR family transcriptional regulator [Niabella hibiscisoli]|uniref:TetR/AcrR family transcriptional regulator n=1 Tax=Niabella hibiscisoli TaxID=1825928 RepID=UPI001F0F7879|nr:TetR/AcrR family transcriptional regulator [Niabella hibiscisoli]MCH5720958.1 TetR/AcrR family transcriptional regulator [Niabella hibiscisoli]
MLKYLFMTTREHIIYTADALIRDKGYNAFSFVDIARVVGIKKPSIHHHFPRKTDLGIAVIDFHIKGLEQIKQASQGRTPIEKLDRFFSIYTDIKYENKVCIVGSLSTDYNTLEPEVQEKIKEFSNAFLAWVTDILKEGKQAGVFHFDELPRTRAVLIIASMMAIVKLSRLTGEKDFGLVKRRSGRGC